MAKIYIDGELEAGQYDADAGSEFITSGVCHLGDDFFDGCMGDIVYHDRALDYKENMELFKGKLKSLRHK